MDSKKRIIAILLLLLALCIIVFVMVSNPIETNCESAGRFYEDPESLEFNALDAGTGDNGCHYPGKQVERIYQYATKGSLA